MHTYRAEHQLPASEADRPGAEMSARMAVSRDVLRQAMADYPDGLPQDHARDEAIRPDGEGGFIVEATLTVP